LLAAGLGEGFFDDVIGYAVAAKAFSERIG
jgi:hypothetical protein